MRPLILTLLCACGGVGSMPMPDAGPEFTCTPGALLCVPGSADVWRCTLEGHDAELETDCTYMNPTGPIIHGHCAPTPPLPDGGADTVPIYCAS